jgi:ribosomal protein S18 acetylase RimI-like enzyme
MAERDTSITVRPATDSDLPALLPLVRAYADFYESDPRDADLDRMCRTLIGDPDGEGLLLAGCDADGAVVGFAAMGWKWSSLRGAKVGYLEDLYVDPAARGSGLADRLIAACAERARERTAPALLWLTRPDNRRARAVYERVGASGEEFVEYELELEEAPSSGG